MLTFSSKQFAQLEKLAIDRATQKFATLLAGRYPQLPPESVAKLDAFCLRGLEWAKALDIKAELHVFGIIYSMSLFGINYLESADYRWAREILTDPHMPEDVRIGLLRLRILIDTSEDIFDHG